MLSRASKAKLGSKHWARPPDWLEITQPAPGVEKIQILMPVRNVDSNYIGFTCQGAYTVDWGDGGGPENFASNVQANHNFAWADIGAGTVTSEGWRQALVTVTPQGGSNLTRYVAGYHPDTVAKWGEYVEWVGNVPNLTWMSFNTYAKSVRAVIIGECAPLITLASIFNMCHSLEYVTPNFPVAASVTSCSAIFQACYRLRRAPLFDTSNCTTVAGLVSNCNSLTEVPLYDTSSATNASSMFTGCYSLVTIPKFDFSNVTNAGVMFNGCQSLRTIPELDFSKTTTASNMFSSCYNLETLPALDFSSCTTLGTCFFKCQSLRSIESITTSAALVTCSYVFSTCYSLEIAPLFDTQNVTTFLGIFASCHALAEVPAYDWSKCTIATTPVSAGALQAFKATGAVQDLNLTNHILGVAELDEVYTNLGSAAKTVTVTGNPGTSGDDPSIATAKGWTVTG